MSGNFTKALLSNITDRCFTLGIVGKGLKLNYLTFVLHICVEEHYKKLTILKNGRFAAIVVALQYAFDPVKWDDGRFCIIVWNNELILRNNTRGSCHYTLFEY